ncbi:MAG: NAD-dependent epimerase/dehydratase family protein [Phycisphaeraceae bacterium]
MAERTLVTGGRGFIGSHLVRRLREQGEPVRVLDVAPPPNDPLDAQYVQGSVTDPAAVREAMRGCDRLYHLAGNAHLWNRDRGIYDRVIHQGTRTVLAAARELGVQRVVHTSTHAIVHAGNRADDMPGPYFRAKFLAEQAARQAADAGLPVVIISPTLPIGPGDHRLTPPSRMLLGYLNGELPGYLESALDLADVRDVAEGHLLAAERGRAGERYILGGRSVQLSTLLRTLGELTGLGMPRLRVPYPLALAVSAVQQFVADHVTHRPPQSTLCGVRTAAHPADASAIAADRDRLGLAVRPLEQSLADTVHWFADAGLLKRQPREMPGARRQADSLV